MERTVPTISDGERIHSIAAIITELRQSRGLKQKDIAEHLHMSVSAITHYEQGLSALPAEVVIKLADFYDVSADYILCRCENSVNYTKVIDLPLGKGVTIGDAVMIMQKTSKANKEAIAQIIKIMSEIKNQQ